MIHCDALIVGGGPAGLAAALALRQNGLDTVVADALHPPIDKACGEGLMPDALKDLTALGMTAYEDNGALFDGITFHSGRHHATALFTHGPGMGIRRLRLHEQLMQRCDEIGVRMAWGTHVTVAPGTALSVDGKRCVYRYLVGADGQASRVRLALGLEEGKVSSRRFGVRRHFRVRPWSRTVEVYWGDLGQAYVTPVGPEEVGVATVARCSTVRLEDMLASLPELGERLRGARTVTSTRGALTTARKLRRVTAGSSALVGDASGSVDAVTGEGIGLSFRQALVLAKAIAADDLSIYQRGHVALMRMPHLMSKALLALDEHRWLRNWAMARLAGQPQLFGRLLALHLGEQTIDQFLRDLPTLGLNCLRPAGSTRFL